MIKVLFVGISSRLGGIETFIMNYYRNIDKEKIRIDFLAFEKEICFQDEIIKTGGKVFYTPPRRRGLIHYIELVKFFNKHKDYDIIHSNLSTCRCITTVIVAKVFGVKIISHSHTEWKGKSKITLILHYLNRPILNKISDYKFACSGVAGKWLFGKNAKFTIIPNSINAFEFSYCEKTRNIKRKELKIEEKLVIGHVGRFVYQKNHEFLLDIFKEINNIVEDSILVLVGDGELKVDIIKKIHRLDLEKSVVLLGLRSDVEELMQAFDLFVLPSNYEGFPMTLIEAQAAGLPCVISDNITSEIMITDLVEKASLDIDPKDWAEIIIGSYKNNIRRNTYDEICASGYDIKKSALELENIYRAIV